MTVDGTKLGEFRYGGDYVESAAVLGGRRLVVHRGFVDPESVLGFDLKHPDAIWQIDDVGSLAFDPLLTRAVVTLNAWPSTVYELELGSGELKVLGSLQGDWTTAALAVCGSRVALAQAGRVCIMDKGGVREFVSGAWGKGDVDRMAFSPDGHTLVVCPLTLGVPEIWSIEAGQSHVLDAPEAVAEDVACTDGGAIVVEAVHAHEHDGRAKQRLRVHHRASGKWRWADGGGPLALFADQAKVACGSETGWHVVDLRFP